MVDVKVLGGSRSIGGNFVRIEDGDRVLIFDQGIRFDVMANYYSSLITPRGVAELRSLGALPRAEWYESVDCIYISHMHLDHLGALSNIPLETHVRLPSLPIYMDIEERYGESPTWLALVPRKYYVEVEELKPLEVDENGVIAIPVSHSAHPAYALLYIGENETVLYTGDFRVDSFLEPEEFIKLNGGQPLLSYFEENPDMRVDKLVIEGTNLGSDRPPINPSEAMGMTLRLAQAHRPIIATLHGLDLEHAYSLLKLAGELNLEVYIASNQLAKLLERIWELPTQPRLLNSYIDHPSRLGRVLPEEIEEEGVIITSYREVLELLRDLATEGSIQGNPVALLSEPEPEAEEASEYRIMGNWMLRLGVECYRIRASGHYYPYQLKTIIKTIKPNEIIPIHTLNPEQLYTLSKITKKSIEESH